MNNETGLEKIATKDNYWLEIIQDGVEQGLSREESLDAYGQSLAAKVAVGLVNIKQLKQMVRLVNVIDAEATSYAGGDISSLSGEEFEEADARRFAHHGMKRAVRLVNSWGQRNSFFATQESGNSWPDLSSFGNRYLLDR